MLLNALQSTSSSACSKVILAVCIWDLNVDARGRMIDRLQLKIGFGRSLSDSAYHSLAFCSLYHLYRPGRK